MSETPTGIRDSNVETLALHARSLREEYEKVESDPWKDSPFGWIKTRPSRQVGVIGERLVQAWCLAEGFEVHRSPDSEADRVIEGYRVEIKFSTLWKGGGYKFQQIRDQDYEFLFALGISPFNAHAWVIPKTVLLEYVIGHMGQHTGARATDTAWLSVKAGAEPEWLRELGGTLAAARDVLAAFGRGGKDRSP